MGNLKFDRIKTGMGIFLVAFLVISATAGAVSASGYKDRVRNNIITSVQIQTAVDPQVNVATATVIDFGGSNPISIDIQQSAQSWIDQHESFRLR